MIRVETEFPWRISQHHRRRSRSPRPAAPRPGRARFGFCLLVRRADLPLRAASHGVPPPDEFFVRAGDDDRATIPATPFSEP